MPDVYLDYDAMAASQRAYRDMQDLLTTSTAAMADVSGADVPQEDLRSRLEELNEAWGSGIEKLAEYAQEASTRLEGSLDAFAQLDAELAGSGKAEGGQK